MNDKINTSKGAETTSVQDETITNTTPAYDPWDRLMNAGSSFDTFILLLGPILITVGLCLITWALTRAKRKRHNERISEAMELPINSDSPS